MGNLQDIEGRFADHGILNFTPAEVTRTNANLADVKIVTLVSLQEVRTNIARRIHLIRNGLTTGNHVAVEHPNGLAVDSHLDLRDGPITSNTLRMLFVHAIRAGFTGIGIYWNGVAYSFHFDLRPLDRFAVWMGVKDRPAVGSWRMTTIIGQSAVLIDPVQLLDRLKQN